MRLKVTALLLVATTIPALAQDEMVALSPAQYGEIFCMSRLGNDMGPVTGILTPDLTTAIAEAETKDAKWAEANPGEKPPLGDGIPWQSWPDYAPECRAEATTTGTDTAEVAIHYSFPSAPQADFTDILLMKSIDTEGYGIPHWRIDNIRFDDGRDLVSSLALAFEDGA